MGGRPPITISERWAIGYCCTDEHYKPRVLCVYTYESPVLTADVLVVRLLSEGKAGPAPRKWRSGRSPWRSRSGGAGPVASGPSTPGSACQEGSQLLDECSLAGRPWASNLAVPFGWMAPAPQYPDPARAAVNSPTTRRGRGTKPRQHPYAGELAARHRQPFARIDIREATERQVVRAVLSPPLGPRSASARAARARW